MAALSGDARRALDICRRATELAEGESCMSNKNQLVTMIHVNKALEEMFCNPKIMVIRLVIISYDPFLWVLFTRNVVNLLGSLFYTHITTIPDPPL